MEEPEQGSHAAEDRSFKTAEALRALRAGLGAKLESHRRRITDLETDLTSRVMQIAEELSREQALESQAALALHEDHQRKIQETLADREATIAELERQISTAESDHSCLSAELTAARAAVETVRVETCEDCAQLRQEIVALNERDTRSATQIGELQAEVAELSKALALAREATSNFAAHRAADETALAESRDEVTRAHQLLSEKTTELDAAEERASEAMIRLDELLLQVARLNEEIERSHAAEAELLAQLSTGDRDVMADNSVEETERQRFADEVVEITAERDALAEQLEQLSGELSNREESSASELSWLEKECESAAQSRQQLAAEFEELLKQHKTAEETHAAQQAELEKAYRKFELALADAQKLKRENAELQEELARRPQKSQSESPELVSLRVERDALASRVADLEATPAREVDQETEQRLADLQRRFELAVEDLRRLKQENAQLQENLARDPQPNGSAQIDLGAAMDWQSQKARLLASLESEEAEDQTPEQCQERATIENTISVTDRVVAEKEREVAELRLQLADRSFEAVEISNNEMSNEVLDHDELIVAERAKLAELQKEWHDKLRDAEMEMSVQRATLARKEAEIEQKSQAAQQAAVDAPLGPDGKPRRKWLAALGLRDDDEK